MYAIIQDGGHQYRVENGQRLRVELRQVDAGATITFDQVRLIADEGQEPRIGKPFVDGATVEAKVVNPLFKSKKIDVQTFKRRKNVHRKIGHRQKYTEVEITGISG